MISDMLDFCVFTICLLTRAGIFPIAMSNSLYVSCFKQKQNKAKTIMPDYGAMKKIIDDEALY